MQIRRVQFTGGSSYVMTLPKEWIDAQKIKKNDPIGIEEQSDDIPEGARIKKIHY